MTKTKEPVKIGHYLVSVERETYRIFPKKKVGEKTVTVPVTRSNIFLNLRCTRSGSTIVFKRYLHMKQWYWRDSRDQKPCDEVHVLEEVARMLYGRDTAKATDLLLSVVFGQSLPA